MNYYQALEEETAHIVEWVHIYDEDDIKEKLQNLKIYMLICSEGYGNEEVNSLDEKYRDRKMGL